MMQFIARGCGIDAAPGRLTPPQRVELDDLVRRGLARLDKRDGYVKPDTVPLAPPPGCELDRFSTGKPCGRPAKYVWAFRDGTMFICERCSISVDANGGNLQPIAQPATP